MSSDQPDQSRVIRLDHARRARAARREPPSPPGLEDYEKAPEDFGSDDYRHRMLVNVAAFVFLVLLVGAGWWIADTMALHRKNQDCVLSGRRGCTPVDAGVKSW